MRESDVNKAPLTWVRNIDKKGGEVSFAVTLAVEQPSLLKEVRVLSTCCVRLFVRVCAGCV